jgi:hypothetical protein
MVTSHTIFSRYNYGNQDLYFTVGQKQHKGSDVTMETKGSSLLWVRNDQKALLGLGIKDVQIYFEQISEF